MATTASAVTTRASLNPITVAYEHPLIVRMAHWLNAAAVFVMITSGLQIFRAFPSFGPKLPQQNFYVPPTQDHPWRMAGRRLAMALHLHVDLRRQRFAVRDLSDRQRPLAPGAVYAARHQRRVADGAPLLSVRQEATGRGRLQSAAEAGLHFDDLLRRDVHC